MRALSDTHKYFLTSRILNINNSLCSIGFIFAFFLKRNVCREIVEQKEGKMISTINKTKTREEICRMLECLFSQDELNCKKCKNCEKVDACCFLSEAVFVYHYKYKNTKNREDLKL